MEVILLGASGKRSSWCSCSAELQHFSGRRQDSFQNAFPPVFVINGYPSVWRAAMRGIRTIACG